MRSLVYCRLLRAINCVVVASVAFTFVAFAPALAGQTLFQRPDTTPAYASYRYLEDCQMAALRVTDQYETRRDTIWYDTAAFSVRELHDMTLATSRRPDTAITTVTVCLNKFDADTAQFWSIGYARYIVEMLLMAHRDQDARRFAQRFLDSMRQKPADTLQDAFDALTRAYGFARPARLNEAKHYYTEWLDILKNDSLYRTVDAALIMARIAQKVGDTVSFEEAGWRAIRTNDATPEKERRASPSANPRLAQLAGLLSVLTEKEGLDSIAISTTAYALYQANTVNARIYGEGQRRTPKEIELFKVPDVVGEHYYVASHDSSSNATRQRLAPYMKKGAVPQGEIPVRNRVNLIVGIPSQCHVEGLARWIDKMKHRDVVAQQCMSEYARLRRMKQRFPDLEVTILSSTYGTVGLLGPLEPANEADTLAKLFLGFHRVPARLVVETRSFFYVAEPDGRRVDLPTPYAEALGREATNPLVFLTDKEGYSVSIPGGVESDVAARYIDILMKRSSK